MTLTRNDGIDRKQKALTFFAEAAAFLYSM
jgi:hypothetical protein